MITPIFFDRCGDVDFLAYARQNDTTTIFEVNLLVGTRVQGDTVPRPILVVVPTTDADLTPLFQRGDAVVGYLINSAGNGSSTWIGERKTPCFS